MYVPSANENEPSSFFVTATVVGIAGISGSVAFFSSHFAVKEISFVIFVAKSNFVSPSYQPTKSKPSFVGAVGSFAVPLYFTVIASTPESNVTLYSFAFA